MYSIIRKSKFAVVLIVLICFSGCSNAYEEIDSILREEILKDNGEDICKESLSDEITESITIIESNDNKALQSVETTPEELSEEQISSFAQKSSEEERGGDITRNTGDIVNGNSTIVESRETTSISEGQTNNTFGRNDEKETTVHVHTYLENEVLPTCVRDGYVEYTCDCGYSYREYIQKSDHIWNDATCILPKICVICGETEGSALGHQFTNYVCTKCGVKDESGIALSPSFSLKRNITYAQVRLNGELLSVKGFTFCDGSDKVAYGGTVYSTTPYEADENDPYKDMYLQPSGVYKGIIYYENSAKGDYYCYVVTDSEIIVLLDNKEVIKFSLNLEGDLVVIYSAWSYINVGEVYSPFQFE